MQKTNKKIAIAAMIIALAGVTGKTNAQWTLSGNTTTAPNNVLGTNNATDLDIRTGGVNRMYFRNSNGFIGIGTVTPGFLLDIQNSGNASMNFKSATGNANILIDRGSSANTASVNYRTGGIATWQTGSLNNDNFVINNVSLAPAAVTVLKTNNNVGIGIAAPTQKLHVVGNILATGNVNAVSFIGTGNIDVSGYVGFGSVEQLTDGGSNTIASNSSFVPTTGCSYDLGTSALRWNNVNVCSTVGIGVTGTAAVPLHVGTGTDVGPASGGFAVFGIVSGLNLAMDNNEIMARNNGVASDLTLNQNGGNVVINGTNVTTGNVLIGTTTSTAAKVQIIENDDAGMVIGDYSGLQNYLTVNKPTSSNSTGVFRARENGSTIGTFNLLASTFQFTVNGDAQASGGTWVNSDRRIKHDIAPIDNVMENIMKLKPATYYFNRDQEQYKYLNLPKEQQFGLIAQELKEVFPNVVREYTNYDEDGKARPETMHSVNYNALIPVLIKGIQEQENTIEMKNQELDAVKQEVTQLKEMVSTMDKSLAQCCMSYEQKSSSINAISSDVAKLEQNTPNPFSENTVIKFYIPQSAGNGVIKVYSLDGSELKSIVVSTKGLSQTEISGKSLSAGTYTYMLLLDGKVVDTKQMVLTK
ncbi:MAG: tail fiber domain-containing protein [Bacteroidota bacterium]